MRRFLILALAAMMSILPVMHAEAVAATTYYVSPAGSDANPGTQSFPWKTIGKAASIASGGDTVIIGAGRYDESVTFSRSGTSSAPITFTGAAATVNTLGGRYSSNTCLDTRNTCVSGYLTISGNYVTLKYLEVVGPTTPSESAGIVVKGSYNKVQGNYLHNTWKEGVAVRETSTGTQVLSNFITYAVVSGIWFDGSSHLIQGNVIKHTVTRQPDGTGLSTDTDADGIRFFGSGSVVKRNIIKDIYVEESPASDYPHSDCFQTWRDVDQITFDGNYCELSNSSQVDPKYKFFMISKSASSSVGGIYIINNVFVSKAPTTLWTPLQVGSDSCTASYPLFDIVIDSNTFIRTGSASADAAILLRCAYGVNIHNNAFYNFGNSSNPYILEDQNNNNNVVISYNAVYTTSGVVPEGGPYPGDDIPSIWMKDPLFVSVPNGDFSLQSGSPLIDSGGDLTGTVDHDFNSVARPEGAGFDIGAYEYHRPITVSGNVGEGGVKLTYYDGGVRSVVSADNGDYSLNVGYKWSGTVTPSKTYHTFNPQSRSYSNVTANITGQDYTFQISIFADVPTTFWAWTQIEAMYNAGITAGCGDNPRIYCPSRAVTRAEMAVFILKAREGSSYAPPPVEISSFDDVPTVGKEWMTPWVEQFYNEGITSGCGTSPLRYCPERPVTRAEMAVYILLALNGSSWTPPPVETSSFSDVPVAGKEWMVPWIEAFYNAGLTSGCASNPLRFCPQQSVTRAQMAVYLSQAFNF